jgi:hypothetical protein
VYNGQQREGRKRRPGQPDGGVPRRHEVNPMPAESRSPDSVDQFCHDVKTPLTTIRARAQLLARAIRRSSALSAEEQDKLVAGLSSIDNAVLQVVSRIDGFAAGEAGPEASGSRHA